MFENTFNYGAFAAWSSGYTYLNEYIGMQIVVGGRVVFDSRFLALGFGAALSAQSASGRPLTAEEGGGCKIRVRRRN
jgi:hypothetical protein